MSVLNEFDQSDYEKIGVRTFFVLKRDNRWMFEKNGEFYDFAPAQITDMALSPVVVGTDRLINIGCKLKKLSDYENGFILLVSDNYFPSCDVKMVYKEPLYDGWLYDVYEENLKGMMSDQGAWICPYIKFYYKEPPNNLYLKMESIPKNSTPI